MAQWNWGCTLFEQYDAVIDFCLKHLNLAGRMDAKFREDRLTVPYEAIKEAAVNMLCHRSWNEENATPSVAIYDDRIVLQNPGSFPFGLSWRDFVNGSYGSLPANPTIANVFYRRGTMETWGRGIGLLMKSCAERGMPAPVIENIRGFINLTIHFLASHTPSHTPSEAVEKILQYCRVPRSMAEISAMLGVKDARWVRKQYVVPILRTLLEMTIPEKPRSRHQKYRTIQPKQ